jgi:hypothetical protein
VENVRIKNTGRNFYGIRKKKGRNIRPNLSLIMLTRFVVLNRIMLEHMKNTRRDRKKVGR